MGLLEICLSIQCCVFVKCTSRTGKGIAFYMECGVKGQLGHQFCREQLQLVLSKRSNVFIFGITTNLPSLLSRGPTQPLKV